LKVAPGQGIEVSVVQSFPDRSTEFPRYPD
jgi:hypothetical protein